MGDDEPDHSGDERLEKAKDLIEEAAHDYNDEGLYELARVADDAAGGAEVRTYIRHVQERTAAWREEAINGDPTPLTQAAHTSVEANELLDLLVKDETYQGRWATEDVELRREVVEEAGDVIVAHLGTLSLLGVDVGDAIDAALDKNGARDWDGWQGGE